MFENLTDELMDLVVDDNRADVVPLAAACSCSSFVCCSSC